MSDDRPFGGTTPPAALFYYSRDRGGVHPQAHLAGYSGILQADAYGGYGKLYEAGRRPGVILEAGCWAHARQKFFVSADVESVVRRKASSARPERSRRYAWKRCAASTDCQTSSGISMDAAPISDVPCDNDLAHPW